MALAWWNRLPWWGKIATGVAVGTGIVVVVRKSMPQRGYSLLGEQAKKETNYPALSDRIRALATAAREAASDLGLTLTATGVKAIVAQALHEGGTSTFNNAYFGMMAGRGYPEAAGGVVRISITYNGGWVKLRTWERIPGHPNAVVRQGLEADGSVWVRFMSPFRAYANPREAIRDRLAVKSFRDCFDALNTGDPARIAACLKAKRYYTATEESYATALRSRFALIDARGGIPA